MIFWYCFRVHEDTDKCMSKSIEFEQISDCSASTTTLSPIQSTVPKRKYAMVFIYVYTSSKIPVISTLVTYFIFSFSSILSRDLPSLSGRETCNAILQKTKSKEATNNC